MHLYNEIDFFHQKQPWRWWQPIGYKFWLMSLKLEFLCCSYFMLSFVFEGLGFPFRTFHFVFNEKFLLCFGFQICLVNDLRYLHLLLELFLTSQQLAIKGTPSSILFLVRDSCCLVIFKFYMIFQIFVFVSKFNWYFATVNHQKNHNFQIKASILFLARDFCCIMVFNFFVYNFKYLLLFLNFLNRAVFSHHTFFLRILHVSTCLAKSFHFLSQIFFDVVISSRTKWKPRTCIRGWKLDEMLWHGRKQNGDRRPAQGVESLMRRSWNFGFYRKKKSFKVFICHFKRKTFS